MSTATWTREHAPRYRGEPNSVIAREWEDAWRSAHALGNGERYTALCLEMDRCQLAMQATTDDCEQTVILARMWAIAEERRQLITPSIVRKR